MVRLRHVVGVASDPNPRRPVPSLQTTPTGHEQPVVKAGVAARAAEAPRRQGATILRIPGCI